MSQFKSNLDQVRIAAPCTADWETMFGDERVRFCGQCQLNVYNLSEMSREEAERFISQTERRLCVRYYLRKDGSIITRNCPVGLRAIKRRLSRVATAIGTTLLSFFGGIGVVELTTRKPPLSEYSLTGNLGLGDTSETIPPVSDEVFVNIDPLPELIAVNGRLELIEPGKVKRRPLRR